MLSFPLARRTFAAGAIAAALVRPSLAQSAPNAGHVVGDFAQQAIAMLAKVEGSAGLPAQALTPLVRETFDLPMIAKLSLGKYWRQADEAQRQRYVALFERYVETVYLARLASYRGERIEVGASSPAGEDTIVETRVIGGDVPVRLDWRLRDKDGRFVVIDLVVEGVSLVMTQRGEFAAVLERHGGDMNRFLDDLEASLRRAG